MRSFHKHAIWLDHKLTLAMSLWCLIFTPYKHGSLNVQFALLLLLFIFIVIIIIIIIIIIVIITFNLK